MGAKVGRRQAALPSRPHGLSEGVLSYDEERIEADRLRKGKFIVATNVLRIAEVTKASTCKQCY
jgi:hypothetical protein